MSTGALPGRPDVAQFGPVLVVEDDAVVRRLICRALEEDGLRVVPAANGQVAIEHARRHAPALVVLDVTLPLLSSDAVAERIRAILGDQVPILVITADGHPAEKARVLRAFSYLQKPFDIDELVGTVRRALAAPGTTPSGRWGDVGADAEPGSGPHR
jgi:DNA-binding response OmpR family regulator